MSKLLEIFKPGTYVSMEGQKITFSASDVAATVAAYDPAKHRAPFVIGHPKTEDPAYGHAAKLSLSSSNVVLAEAENVEPAFADAVNNERYDSISAQFWSPDNPRNPVPGVWYIRHIGFLGAVPPAVPGLSRPSFAAEPDAITINFADPTTEENLMPLTPEQITAQEELAKKQASFADEQKNFADKSAALDARAKELADREAKARTDEITSFASELEKEGRLLPVEKSAVVALLTALPNEQSVSFADGDGKTVNQASADVLKNFLKALPPRVSFAEVAGTDKTEQASSASFAAPTGYTVDASQTELHNKITAHAKANNMTYAQAAVAIG